MEIFDAQWRFCTNFFTCVSKEDEGNLVISPQSAHLALALALAGARGETEREIVKVLAGNLDTDSATVLNWAKWIVERMTKPKEITLDIGNKMFVQENLPIDTSAMDKFFKMQIEEVDFAEEETVTKINDWAAESTQGLITSIVEKDIPTDIKIMLMNAVHFKGLWAKPFEKGCSKLRPFYSNGFKVNAEYMKSSGYFGFANIPELDAQVLELPYMDSDFTFVTILPNKKDGLGELEQKLQNTKLEQIMDQVNMDFGKIFLPKFHVEAFLDLQNPLQKMGCSKMFGPDADFSGLCKSEPLRVAYAGQKCFIEVDDKGTKSAAGTDMAEDTEQAEAFVFDANHPFLFYVMYCIKDSIRSVVMAGRIWIPLQPFRELLHIKDD